MKTIIYKKNRDVKITAPEIAEINFKGKVFYFIPELVLTVPSNEWEVVETENELADSPKPRNYNYYLNGYAPLIANQEKAREIFGHIWSLNPRINGITIDATEVEAMTIKCAQIIFGGLYKLLGNELYHKNLHILGNEDIGIVVRLGIEKALEE